MAGIKRRGVYRGGDGAGGDYPRHYLDRLEDERDQLWEERVQSNIKMIMSLLPGNIKTHRMEESFIEPLMSEIISHLLVNHNDHDELIRARVDDFLNKSIDEILVELEQEKVEIAVREGVIKSYREILFTRIENQYILARSFIGFLQRKGSGSLAGLIKEDDSDVDNFLSIVPVKEGGLEKSEIRLFLERHNISKLYDDQQVISVELNDVLVDNPVIVEEKKLAMSNELTADEKKIKLEFRDEVVEFISLLEGDCRATAIDKETLFNMRWRLFDDNRLRQIIPEKDPLSLKKISDLKTVLEKECGVYDSSIG